MTLDAFTAVLKDVVDNKLKKVIDHTRPCPAGHGRV